MANIFDEVSNQDPRNEAVLDKYPAAVADRARMLSDYLAPITGYMLARNPVWGAAAMAAKEYDPSFNIGQYDIRQGVRKDFTSGQTSKGLASLNMVIKHLDDLKDASKDLDNTGFTPLNAVKNWWENETNDPRPGRFNTIGDAAATELVNATRGTGGAEADIQNWRKNLDVNAGPKIQQGNIDAAIDLLSGRISSYRQKYEKGMGRPPIDMQFLDPRSREILTGMGFDPNKIEQGVKAKDARLKTSTPVTATEPDPTQHYIPGHSYGGKVFSGPGIDQGVNDPANWK